MSFDPHNVRRYVIESRGQGDPGAVLVAARDFDQLLAMVKSQEVLIQELRQKAYIYEAAFDDVMYQEFSSNPNSIAGFLESAEMAAEDRLKEERLDGEG